jgi:amidase
MNRFPGRPERDLASLWPTAEALGLSRREFLRQLGHGGTAAALAVHAPMSWLLPAAQAETTPTKSTDELIYASATALAKAIREKRVSAEEVVMAYLRRIEAINPKLNAVVQLTAATARAQAREADAALARGETKGPLHGVPFTVKDNIETAGVICTVGTKGRAAFVPRQDATIVARMRTAGAIMLGKTNLPELGLATETDNLVYGRTNNPYDLARTPGGSSGGEGALIAAGGSPCGLGNDLGGSIRIPAHFCGIAGIKPTSGRLPKTGISLGHGGAFENMWQHGPLARSVEDLYLILSIITGPDGRDPSVAPAPLGDPKTIELKKLRIAFHTDNGLQAPTAETVATVKASAKVLADAGVAVEENRPKEIEQGYEIFIGLLGADGGVGLQRLLQLIGSTELSPFMQQYLRLVHLQSLSTTDFLGLMFQWDMWRSVMLTFMDTYDAILCPASAYPAPPHRVATRIGSCPAFSYTSTYNLAGWPGAVVRGGTSPEGLPIGVQIVARPWREEVALAVAQHIETALGGWQRPPL